MSFKVSTGLYSCCRGNTLFIFSSFTYSAMFSCWIMCFLLDPFFPRSVNVTGYNTSSKHDQSAQHQSSALSSEALWIFIKFVKAEAKCCMNVSAVKGNTLKQRDTETSVVLLSAGWVWLRWFLSCLPTSIFHSNRKSFGFPLILELMKCTFESFWQS